MSCLRHHTGAHNDANELTSLDPDGSGGGAAGTLTHDKAGNIVSKYVSYADADNYKKYTYVHDAWNRLVQIAYEEMVDGDGLTPIQVADYRYNGLTWRITKKADTSLPTVDGLDEMHVYIYSQPLLPCHLRRDLSLRAREAGVSLVHCRQVIPMREIDRDAAG